MTEVIKELPLMRAKVTAIYNQASVNPNVGPGSYDIGHKISCNTAYAPFGMTSERLPLCLGSVKTPGPGAYDIAPALLPHKNGVATCSFLSTSLRFPFSKESSTPGPGAYELADKWPTKKICRAHTFPVEGGDGGVSTEVDSGSGFYPSNEYPPPRKAGQRTVNFDRYSGRDCSKQSSTPGPGSYETNSKAHTLYDSKPSSMFVSTTARSQPPITEVPGPGTYEIPSGFAHSKPSEYFGYTAPRFPKDANGESPGPGHYTGNIAPRRPQPFNASQAFPFSSTADRFIDNVNTVTQVSELNIANPLPKKMHFGGESPFGSTVPRFHQAAPAYTREVVDCRTSLPSRPLRFPRRVMQPQNILNRDTKPQMQSKVQPRPFYDIKYDWPKPTTLKSTFGDSTRIESLSRSNEAPGPGSYNLDHHPDVGNSSWGRDIRFTGNTTNQTPGAGAYHHESTFLRKSHNQTTAFHTTW